MFGLKWSSTAPAPQTGFGFAVDDVVPEHRAIYGETLSVFLAGRFRREILLLPDPSRAVINSMMDDAPVKQPGRRVGTLLHPLMDAVHYAFSKHFPLTLSPDAIWLTIAQGFSHHITENAENLRGRLVRHQGRRPLVAQVKKLSVAGFADATASISSQIRDASDSVLHETLLCDFSTSTPNIRIASEIVLMDTYSSYFEYYVGCICGIPRVTVTGTLDDWQRIRARVEILATYDLEWWVSRLRPILDQFIRTAEGYPDREFWQAIYKPRHSYALTSVTGWIADLFPYLRDGPKRPRNHVFGHERKRWSVTMENGVETRSEFLDPQAAKGTGLGSFPSGLSSVPVTLVFPIYEQKVDLVAGYFGVEQNAADFSLSPLIGWCITVPPPAKPILVG